MKRLTKTLVLTTALSIAPIAAPAQDWAGPYIGAYGALVDSNTTFFGGYAGYNYDLGGGAYAGVEIDGMYDFDADEGVATAQARLAYELNPEVLVYGQLGAGVGSTTNWWVAGVGGELAVMNNISLRLGVDRYDEISGPGVNWAVKAGVGYHF